jgi:molecular chaperone DnaJ
MNGSRAWYEKDFYKTLGLAEGATADEIKRAYRKLAQKHHPDRNPGDSAAEERMKEVSEAYDVLSDPKKRQEYDQVRRMGAGGFRGFPGGGGGGRVRFEDVPFDLGDMLGDLFGGGRFGGGRGRGPRRGEDLEAEIRVSFEDAMRGVTVPVRVTRDVACPTCGGTGDASGNPQICPRCNGSGSIGEEQGLFSFVRPCPQCGGNGRIIKDPCKTCRGSGTVRRSEEVRVRIPAGIADGARVRARGKGMSGGGGGPGGDLYVTVRVAPHPLFGRRDGDLTLTVPITFPEAALGTELKVPTLDGSVRLKIPAGTQSGRTFRLRGRGAPRPKGGAGDLMVTVNVIVPEKLSKKEKEFVEKLGETQRAPREQLGV